MSSGDAETPDVLQGRLGWEDGDVSEAKPDELEPHPKNADIYGDTDDVADVDDTFVESVREKGVLEPLVVTDGKKIISGHRRWLAAQAADVDSVPIRKSSFDSDLAEREALVEFNRQREKTPGQIVNEFEEMLAIERDRAKEREKELGRSHGEDPSGNVSKRGAAREKAAEKVNADVSGRTLQKGWKVKDKAESDDEPDEVKEAAQDAWDDLQSGDESFNSAYQTVKTAENRVEKQQRREQKKEQFEQTVKNESAVNIDAGDFSDILADTSEQYDHIITDPPYGQNAVLEWEKLGRTANEVLKPGGLLISYSGKYHLPSVYEALSKNLTYFWQCVVVHAGSGARVWDRNVRTNYKPIIVFAKPPLQGLDGLGHDVIRGEGREKDDHEWQQATGEAVEIIEQLTEPNDLILDPMCGSGTTGVAALEKDRRVHLIDRDDEAVETARERCADVT